MVPRKHLLLGALGFLAGVGIVGLFTQKVQSPRIVSMDADQLTKTRVNVEQSQKQTSEAQVQVAEALGFDQMSEFRQRFLLWEQVDAKLNMDDRMAQGGYPVAGRGYFLYECAGFCGGWADQLKGTHLAYMVANLTGRIFKARYTKLQRAGCSFTDYMVPNKINWDMPPVVLDKDDVFYHNRVGDDSLKFGGLKMNYTNDLIGKDASKKYHVFTGNLNYLMFLKNSTTYSKELSWARDLTPADFYAAVYRRMFKLHPRLQARLQGILAKALPTPRHRLVCLHVRLGHEAFGSDWARRNSIANMPKIWKFMTTQLKSPTDKLFVMSDSEGVLNYVRNVTEASRLITVPGPIVHTNKFSWKTDTGNSSTSVCGSLERLLLEQHLLMNCDVMVRGHSGLSVFATFLRGSDKDLYCLEDDGEIVKCERNNLLIFG